MWVSFCILNLCLLLKYDSPVVLALGCAESGCGADMEQFLAYRKGLINISSLSLASTFLPATFYYLPLDLELRSGWTQWHTDVVDTWCTFIDGCV